MRPILCHHIARLFHVSDVLTSAQYPLISSQYVCKRHRTSTKRKKAIQDWKEKKSQKRAKECSNIQEFNTFMVVGLGNLHRPKTRHSVGMQMLDEIAMRRNTDFTINTQCETMEATSTVGGVSLILVKPKLPMNSNGKCVAKSLKHHNINKDNLVVIHDDQDVKYGNVVLKEKGGDHGGHNGVKSVATCIPKGKSIVRVSIGIGKPQSSSRGSLKRHVLGPFTTDEQDGMSEILGAAIIILGDYLSKRTNKNITAILRGKDSL